MNETHDPKLKSWVDSANLPNTDFPIQNLPLGMFRRIGSQEPPRAGVAIGDQILDLEICWQEGLYEEVPQNPKTQIVRAFLDANLDENLNSFLSLGNNQWTHFRRNISHILRADNPQVELHKNLASRILIPMKEAELLLPVKIGDYTDFYASVFHATNVGSMFRPDNPLLPNYKYIPIGYHGRASSVVASGTPVRRPWGQLRPNPTEPPIFSPCKLLDYELEVGIFMGTGQPLGEQISIEKAEQHIFGLCLLNDWSARDIQTWEYQPLGPFLAKSFATTISPWIITLEALAPFRTHAFNRPEGDPQPLEYLSSTKDQKFGGLDLTLEVFLSSQLMREKGFDPVRLSQGNFKDLYWTIAQMVTHHASNGCNLRPGDLLGSGTVSGTAKESRGCLLELTWRGSEPFELPTGELRKFLENGDEVTIRGYCEREGFVRIGFGECRGIVTPALPTQEN